MNHRIAIVVFFVGLSCIASAGGRHDRSSSSQVAITTRVLNANRFNIQITDRGDLITNTYTTGGGVWWYNDAMNWCVVYDQGPWIIGKMNGRPAMGASYWGTTYLPGPMIDGRPALEVHPQDSVRFHPYKISRTSTSSEPDLSQWPADLGAPTDKSGTPLLLGDQMVWSVFNGVDSSVVLSDWTAANRYPHVPVEIHQSFYAREGSRGDTSLLANSAFVEWTFINKSEAVIDSCYIGLWADLDLWTTDNPFGIDTVNQTAYCWDDLSLDSVHSVPKAVGITLLYGPRVPDAASSALFRGERIHGYRNMPMSSFWGIRTDWAGSARDWPIGPNTIQEAWNIARGYDKSGQVIIDSVTHLPTRFPWSGDPLTGTGWIYTGTTEGEGGLMFFTGPFTFTPGDTQWTMMALLPAASVDKLEGIRAVRNNAQRIRAMSYEDIARPRPLSVRVGEELPMRSELLQNYPNPFNPVTTIEYTVGGTRGEGRGAREAGTGNWGLGVRVKLAIYDLLGREVATLVNEEQVPGNYQVKFDASGLASGVYYYQLTSGNFRDTKKLLLIK